MTAAFMMMSKLSFSLPANFEAASCARRAVRDYLRAEEVSEEIIGDLELCIGEAVTNAVNYSGTDCVDVDCVLDDDYAKVSIRDYGKGFIPSISAQTKMEASENLHGRGCYLLHTYGAAEWELTSPGTKVTFSKLLL